MGANVPGKETYAGVIQYMTDPNELRIIGAGDVQGSAGIIQVGTDNVAVKGDLEVKSGISGATQTEYREGRLHNMGVDVPGKGLIAGVMQYMTDPTRV
jgi:hypothetical protein